MKSNFQENESYRASDTLISEGPRGMLQADRHQKALFTVIQALDYGLWNNKLRINLSSALSDIATPRSIFHRIQIPQQIGLGFVSSYRVDGKKN